MAARGGAAVIVRFDAEARLVLDVESLAFDVEAITNRLAEIADEAPHSRFLVDAEDLGLACWKATADLRRRSHRWRLYDKRGPDRHDLTAELQSSVARKDFRIASVVDRVRLGLLTDLKRDLREGVGPGNATAIALALVVSDVHPPRPWVY